MRVAANREQHLLIKLSVIGKIFCNVRALRKASFISVTKNYDAVTWFWIKLSSFLSAAALLQSGTYTAPQIRFLIFFQWLHMLIALQEEDKDESEENELALEDC